MNIKKMFIEITNHCNLNCSFCLPMEREKEHMTLEVFKKSIEEIKPMTKDIYLHVLGEPTMHPQFSHCIDIAKEMQIHITTNGTLLGQHRDVLNHPSIVEWNISVHGILDHENWKEESLKLLAILDEIKTPVFLRLWHELDEKTQFFIQVLEEKYKTEIHLTKGRQKISDGVYLHRETPFTWPDPAGDIIFDEGRCLALVNNAGILSDGTIIPCCLDGNGNIPLGNIKDGLKPAITSKRATKIVENFRQYRVIEPFCRTCGFDKGKRFRNQ